LDGEASVNDFTHARALWRGLPRPAPGRAGAGAGAGAGRQPSISHQPRHARCPQGAKARSLCLVPLQPQAQAPARTATAAASTTQRGRAGGCIDVPGLVAGRPAASLSRRSGAAWMRRHAHLDRLRALHAHVYAVLCHQSGHRRSTTSNDRPGSGNSGRANAMPTSHPYKASEQEAS